MSECICNGTGFIIMSKREWFGNSWFDFRIVKTLKPCPNENCKHRFVYKLDVLDYATPNEIPEFYQI